MSEGAQGGWDSLRPLLRDFVVRRDWATFHTPKNLAMAIAGEAGELAAEFQWLTPDQSEHAKEPGDLRDAVEGEMADVAIYLLLLADRIDVDVVEAVRRKIAQNEGRFPA